MSPRAAQQLSIAVLWAALAGCPSEEPPACVAVEPACTPLYLPTFENVFNNTLRVGCGSQLSSCHSANGLGAMSLVDPATAHASLLAGRVQPGDASCSELIVRVVSHGTDYEMPPGAPLSDAEVCSLIQWVQNGAPGPAAAAPARAATGGVP